MKKTSFPPAAASIILQPVQPRLIILTGKRPIIKVSLHGRDLKPPQIIHLLLPQDDPMQRKPDISLAKKMLNGWEPTVQLEEGLTKTIAYFEKRILLD